jgi:hypothetical protein
MGAILVLIACPLTSSAIDFSNPLPAAVTFGRFSSETEDWRLATYQGSIYFATTKGDTTQSKLYRYNPVDGLTTIADAATDRFTTIKVMDGLLYMADSSGSIRTYDGTNLSQPIPSFVQGYTTSMTEFNGKKYFGTSLGAINEYNNPTPSYQSPLSRPVSDLISWNNSLYAGLLGDVGTNNGFAVKSNGTDLITPWQTVISSVYCGSDAFLATSNYLYATPTDDVESHSSTVRRSSNGLDFPIINGPGPYKFPNGNPMSLDGTAYIFENGNPSDFLNGYLITDDGTTTTRIPMNGWNYQILAATELNGQVYAIGLDHSHGYNVDGNVYLLTVPEPSTFILLGIGVIGLLTWAWRKR